MPSKTPSELLESRNRPIAEDMDYQRRTWRIERIGWLVLGILVVLALVGGFGAGPLSSTTIRDPSGALEISCDRFERQGASSGIRVALAPAEAGPATLIISHSFFDAFAVESIQPLPVQQRGGTDGIELRFQRSDGGPLTVHLVVRARRAGLVRSAFAVDGKPPAEVTQFVFP